MSARADEADEIIRSGKVDLVAARAGCVSGRLLDVAKIQLIMKTVLMYIGFLAGIVGIAGYYLFLQGWNPVVSLALCFVGLIVVITLGRRATSADFSYQEKE
jgi:CHASE2 domain-containing sensor protein